MEELGAGGTVSELISCHGINHGNQRTLDMLKIDPREKNIGIQLFGEDPAAMAISARKACEFGPKFIDLNMGCPVRKVVTKGGGSALMRDPHKLGYFLKTIKKAIDIPLTIKIRTGWDSDSRNALEIIHIAKEEGVEMVAVHGRTRAQAYKGLADWDFLNHLAAKSPLPIIGNGDLHTSAVIQKRVKETTCQALMLGRGPLRDPFLFLTPYLLPGENIQFSALDYFEVLHRLYTLISQSTDREKTILISMRKFIIWIAAGFKGASSFRNDIFSTPDIHQTMKNAESYFSELGSRSKNIDSSQTFMTSGHG